jgi:predicted ribosome quality control (RQC) complex YloA/Tae2 family protein
METHEYTDGATTYTILCGKSATGNDQLLDMCNPEDVWFHVDGRTSAHVILVNAANEKLNKIPKKVITRCACICKASTKENAKCVVIYTQRKNVEKTEVFGRVIPTNIKMVSI